MMTGPKKENPNGRHCIHSHHARILRGFDRVCLLLRKGALEAACLRKDGPSPFMSNLIVTVISIACLAYLVVAILRPEKF